MTAIVQCPACFSTNEPGQARCRICGHELPPVEESSVAGAPVRLQRVMGSEVYSAVVKEAARVPEVPSAPPAPPTGPPEPEGASEILVVLKERIAQRATATGQRFKPYSADRPRTATSDEARKTVARQLDSAARAFRERRFDNAIEHLLKAIAKEDGDPRSWVLLGEAYIRLDRPYKAAVGYLRALELDPPNDNAWLGLARTLRTMEDLAGSLEILDRTVQLNPSLTEAWSERGIILESLDRPVDAAKSFQKALELRPDHRTARVRFDRLAPRTADAAPEPTEEAPDIGSDATESQPAKAPVVEEEEFPDFADLVAAPAVHPPTPAQETRAHPLRIRTFVEGLDETLGGGIPWGHVVLVEGSPGTMKSSFAFSVLAQNAAHDGMHCLYLSFEERTSGLLKQMGSIGVPLHVSRGSLVVMDPRAAKGLLQERKDWVDAFEGALRAVKAQRGLDLVVIDSLDALEVLAKFKDRRREIFRLFEWLRDLDVTSFVITERPDWVIGGHVVQGRWDEDFLADGVIHLRQHLVSDLEVQRRLRVVKMRGTKHDTGYLALVLDEGRFKVTRAMSQ